MAGGELAQVGIGKLAQVGSWLPVGSCWKLAQVGSWLPAIVDLAQMAGGKLAQVGIGELAIGKLAQVGSWLPGSLPSRRREAGPDVLF